jgi:two-component system phosphate regulon sensor histidine kinase PhoR
MDKSRYWAAIFFGVTAASVSGAIGAAFGLGPVLAAIISCAMGAGGALLAGWALGGMFRTSSDWQIAVPAAEAMEAGLGRELLGDLPLALVLLDSDSRVQLVNKSATDLFGPVAAGEPLSSMARARSLADAVSAVSAGGPPVTVEFVHMRAREQRMLLAHVRAIDAHPARDVSGIMILIEDHTRSEKVEQMRRDFIANASHELKTPLSSIAGIIETLQGPAADDPEARARFLPVMAAQAERMKRLVEDLMSLNRIEMNEHVRPNDVLEIGDVVREAVAALTPMAAGAGVAIEVRLPKTGLSVVGDQSHRQRDKIWWRRWPGAH